MLLHEELSGGKRFIKSSSLDPQSVIEKSVTLSEFLRNSNRRRRLSRRERLRIIDRALVLLDMNYVHLPLKRALHAVDPIQKLKLLKFSLSEMRDSEMSDLAFHRKMVEIFTTARDIHTMYSLPPPFDKMVAYLPFVIESYFDGGERKFLVSRVVDQYYDPLRRARPECRYFKAGVEALYWNGVPIDRAIEINGERQAGSNPEARFARGMDNLTIRPLDTSLPPDEMWVTLTYRTEAGKEFEMKQDWMVFNPRAAAGKKSTKTGELSIYKRAMDHKKSEINTVLEMLFSSKASGEKSDLIRRPIKTGLTSVFRAEGIKLTGESEDGEDFGGKEFGYIRLFTFVIEPDRLVQRMKRVLTSRGFPQEGLILDVRGNGGGQIDAAERLLQLFTPRRIKPELFELINTPLNLEICRNTPKAWEMSQWAASIAESVMTNATYSSGFPITSEESCNDIGQVYYGPVVLITDALSYSATDIFAAGFQDNEVGKVLGASGNTGAGGANGWDDGIIALALGKKARKYLAPTRHGGWMKVAVRRSIRVGKQAGRPLEELGITPDERYYMTREDLLNRNPDLIKKAASLLAKKTPYRLSVTLHENRDRSKTLKISTKNLSRVDVYVNDRPLKSVETGHAMSEIGRIAREKKEKRSVLLLNGFNRSNHLVAMSRRVIHWS